MIRVFVVDDHPALRAGVSTMLHSEPGLDFAGMAGDGPSALEAVVEARPDVVLIDYRLPGENGLVLCDRVKRLADPPAVLIYTALPGASLGVAAAIAGADGLLSKTAPPDELLDAIRFLARGRVMLPPASPERIRACAAQLDPEDVPIFGMLLERTPRAEIAETLNLGRESMSSRVGRIIAKLGADTATPSTAL